MAWLLYDESEQRGPAEECKMVFLERQGLLEPISKLSEQDA